MSRCRSCRISRCRPGKTAQDHHGSGIVIGPTLDYLDRAYLDARHDGWSREPVVEMLIPSTLDDTLAPPGQHVASLFVQHVAPQLPTARSWDDAKEAFADLVIDTVDDARAQLQGQRDRPAGAVAARSGAALRPRRRRHLPRPVVARPALQRRARCWATPTTACRCRRSTCAARARIPAAASRACPGATRPVKSFAISSGAPGAAGV